MYASNHFDNTNKQSVRNAIWGNVKTLKCIRLLTLSSDKFTLKKPKLLENRVLKHNKSCTVTSYEFDNHRVAKLNRIKHDRFNVIKGNINNAYVDDYNVIWYDYCGPLTDSAEEQLRNTAESNVKYCFITIGTRDTKGRSREVQVRQIKNIFLGWEMILTFPYENAKSNMHIVGFKRK